MEINYFYIFRFLSQPIGERKNFKSIYVVFFLGLLHVIQSERQCSLGYGVLNLTYGECVPRRVLTRHCRGSCNSRHQSLIDANSECYNCDVTEVVVRRVSLLCPEPNGRHRFVPRMFDVYIPTRCGCNICGGYNRNNMSNDNNTQSQV